MIPTRSFCNGISKNLDTCLSDSSLLGAEGADVGAPAAEGGGGREIEASVASMAAWMADEGADD